jgi:hypothetical protein
VSAIQQAKKGHPKIAKQSLAHYANCLIAQSASRLRASCHRYAIVIWNAKEWRMHFGVFQG